MRAFLTNRWWLIMLARTAGTWFLPVNAGHAAGGMPAPSPPFFLGNYSNPGDDLFSDLAVYSPAVI